MRSDEIKQIVSESKLVKGSPWRKREFHARRRRVIFSLRRKRFSKVGANEIWFSDNKDVLIATLLGIDPTRFYLSRFSESVIKEMLRRESPEGSFEEFSCLAESLSFRITFHDGEADCLLPAFFLLLAEKIVTDSAASYSYDFTLFHHLRGVRTDFVAKGFSPLEQILRFDPDGIYSRMDRETQLVYQEKIRNMAKRKRISPEKAANLLLERAKRGNRHIGYYLPKDKNSRWYYPLIFLLFLVLSCAFFYVGGPILLFAPAALPLYYLSRGIVRFYYGTLCRPKRLYSMKNEPISPANKTCVVIPCVLAAPKDVDKLIKRIRRFAVNNREENESVTFGLLCDFTESKTPEKDGDEEIRRALSREIERLNQTFPVFFAILRKRIYHACEKQFCGRERKRGAILDLCDFLSTGNMQEGADYFGVFKDALGAKYLITLDADTELSIGQARRLVAIASHPLNRPVISEKSGKRFVESGFGILQPRINSSLLSPIQTRFGKLYSNGSGEIPYAGASFDDLQTLFGEGNFCGKGLIDVEAFHKLIPGVFPKERILSHDMPEGAILRCGIISNEVFCDSNPQDARSSMERLHRWVRGDTQNLFYLHKLPLFRRWIALENFGENLVFLSEVALLVIGAYLGTRFSVAALLLVFLFHGRSCLETALSFMLSGNTEHFSRRFSTLMRNLVLNEIYRFLFSVTAICADTWYRTDAILRALFRMVVSHRHLLQWKVYGSASSKGKIRFYLPPFLLSFAASLITLRTPSAVVFLLTLFYPVLCEFMALPYQKKREWTEKEKRSLLSLAEKEYAFFRRMVGKNTHFLPPDNLQVHPVEKVAMRTSPTNIGMYLVSLVAAKDLSLISPKHFRQEIDKTLGTIESLEKYAGNLYNWYDLETLSVLGNRYVSTVDSGNFLASLIILSSSLNEFSKEEDAYASLRERVERLICETDLSVLYDLERGLFYIGFSPDERQKGSCYDLLMSEARITSFLAISLGRIKVNHWKRLGRPLLTANGRAGVASWSGTAFEYFMPPLFYPVVKDSLEDESLDYALYCQKRYRVRLPDGKCVFGVSESAYPETDVHGTYQYRAFGVPDLSLKGVEKDRVVLSPYSSFLMLERKDPAVLDNLFHLAHAGMVGPLGFYEACAFRSPERSGKRIVYSYMAHHKGMSLMALDNAIMDDVLRNRFFAYPGLWEKQELLAERFPLESRSVSLPKEKRKKDYVHKQRPAEIIPCSQRGEKSFILSDGETTAILDDTGEVSVLTGEIEWAKDLSFSFWDGARFLTDKSPGIESKLIVSRTKVEKVLEGEDVHVVIGFELIPDENALLVCAQCFGKKTIKQLVLTMDPVLCRGKDYASHPAFSKLSLESIRDKNELNLIRRTEHEPVCLHVCSPVSVGLFRAGEWLSSQSEAVLWRDGTSIRFSFEESKSRRIPVLFRLDHNAGISGALSLLDGSYAPGNQSRLKQAQIAARFEEICRYDASVQKTEETLLTSVREDRKMILTDTIDPLPKDFPWRLGLSGDHPIVTVFVKSETDLDTAEMYCKILKMCYLCQIPFDLVICLMERSGYTAPLREELRIRIDAISGAFLTGRSPGIHILSELDEASVSGLVRISKTVISSPLEPEKPVPETQIPIVHDPGKGYGKYSSSVGTPEIGAFQIDRRKFDPDEPLSLVCSNRTVGFVCNQNTLGYTWSLNAALGRISAWDGEGKRGERLVLFVNGKGVDLLANAETVRFEFGKAIWDGKAEKLSYHIEASVSEITGCKIIRMRWEGKLDPGASLFFICTPSVGAQTSQSLLVSVKDDAALFCPAVSGEIALKGFLLSDKGLKGLMREKEALSFISPLAAEQVICFGGYMTEAELDLKLRSLRGNLLPFLREETRAMNATLPPEADLKEGWFAYQTVFSRFFGRTGPFQSSGGYGFRDQLQDCLIFLWSDPSITRRHILRCAAHQFMEGDVQHWWHPFVNTQSGGDPGVRTKCSDDYLWLLYVTAKYLNATNDTAILDLPVPFLSDPDHRAGKASTYFTPSAAESGPLALHLEKCVDLLIGRGCGGHGLARMGDGDWNDGMDLVGGESVWLSEFALICLHGILPYLSPAIREKAKPFSDELLSGIKNSFNGSWFARAYRDDGTALGSDLSLDGECAIDLLPQAFAALLYCDTGAASSPDAKDIRKALKSAYEILVKERERLVLLFTKPFSKTDPSPGYIQRYVAGVRENGGQYTHGAVWLMMALLRFGRKTEDTELIEMAERMEKILDPFQYQNAALWEKYRREPYVLCGDVYAAKGFAGHGGWSWYTGAAGWYWQYLREKKDKQA